MGDPCCDAPCPGCEPDSAVGTASHRILLIPGKERRVRTDELTGTLATLFTELVDGASPSGAYVLNEGDAGLLRTLDRNAASDASARTRTGSSIAAHVHHLRYGLSLMNRWEAGENPFAGADWTESWRHVTVSEAEWQALRNGLREEAARWLAALRTPREVQPIELNGMVGSICHLAYHMGAIRQMHTALAGPRESGS
jgi:hypothetical protein